MFHTRLEVVGCGGDPASSRIRTLFLPSRLLRLGGSRGSRDGPECRGNLLDVVRHYDWQVPDTSWVPLGFSSSGTFSGEVAFLGYGIDAPALDYRELQGIKLKGKIALMLRYEPQERDSASRFDGKKPS